MAKKKKSNKKKAAVVARKNTPYPWDQWLNPERTRSVTISADKFSPAPSVMTQQIYNCAKRRGLKVWMRYFPSLIASTSPGNCAQSPRKSARMVIAT